MAIDTGAPHFNRYDVPDLHIRVASLARTHPLREVALINLLPTPEGIFSWLGEPVSIIGWGCAWETTISGFHAIRHTARIWDEVRTYARVIQDSSTTGENPQDWEAPLVQAPVAFGSFGFSSSTPSFLTIPEVAVIDSGGERYVVTAAQDRTPQDPLDALESLAQTRKKNPVEKPSGLWTETGRMTQNQWVESVRRLIRRLRSAAASKVVMSRDMLVSSNRPLDHRFILERLHSLYPETWAYAVQGLIGATPEMLASMHDGRVISRVLAGTAGPHEGDSLMESMKNRTEHMLAVESVARALSPIAQTLDVPEMPEILTLPNLTHLSSTITATFTDANVLDVVAALHPTAAVCGTPTKLASDLLEEFESTRRGRYSGPVGWVDARGEGEFGIALRCGQISADRRSVRVFAGGGIMPDSVPEMELVETRAKMQPLLTALDL